METSEDSSVINLPCIALYILCYLRCRVILVSRATKTAAEHGAAPGSAWEIVGIERGESEHIEERLVHMIVQMHAERWRSKSAH
jgi:hypothetical protein